MHLYTLIKNIINNGIALLQFILIRDTQYIADRNITGKSLELKPHILNATFKKVNTLQKH